MLDLEEGVASFTTLCAKGEPLGAKNRPCREDLKVCASGEPRVIDGFEATGRKWRQLGFFSLNETLILQLPPTGRREGSLVNGGW